MAEGIYTSPSPDRDLCLSVLSSILHKGAYSTLEVDEAIDRDNRESGHSGFVTEVVFGVLRRLRTLDWLIEHMSGRSTAKLSPVVLDILRIAVYQLLFMDSIPSPIVVNEAVLMARKHSHSGSVGFVNGSLRGLGRRMDAAGAQEPSWVDTSSLPAKARLALAAFGFDPRRAAGADGLALVESQPDWLAISWWSKYGEEEARLLCAAFNRSPRVCVRTNALKTNREELLSVLREEGVGCHAGSLTPEAIICEGYHSIGTSLAYLNGLLQVQDEGAIAIGHLLGPQPGDEVLDVCAAPGGKATHIAELMGNKGRVIALDIHESRLELVRDNARRLGVTIVECVAADARDLSGVGLPQFDRILVDAPCTGTGVVGRKPDIRWRREEDDMRDLVPLQCNILNEVVPLLKPGGTLVYSTCSLQAEENEDNLAWLLETHPELQVTGGPAYYLPHRDGTDGFFAVRLVRRS